MSAPCVRLAPTIDVLSAQYLERHLGPAAVA